MLRFTRWLLIPLVALLVPTGVFSDDYDRMDGKGASGKRVDVVEWEGNLEIHVYPKGGLAGLALKLDTKDKNKLVMVIGYRFTNDAKKQLIRRAILGVPFTENFKAFRDAKEPDFDKIVISNNTLSGDLTAYKLDPPPAQLYPEDPAKNKKVAEKATPPQTSVDPRGPGRSRSTASENTDDDAPPAKAPSNNEDGSIRPFKW